MIKILQYVKVYCKEDGDKSFPMLAEGKGKKEPALFVGNKI